MRVLLLLLMFQINPLMQTSKRRMIGVGVIIAINLGIQRTVVGKYMANQWIGNLTESQGILANSGEKKGTINI